MRPEVSLEVLVTAAGRRAALERDVREGLVAPEKALPPVWFYDETGSRLFDEITRLPEYYPTRAERSILAAHAAAIVQAAGADVLVEIGSGTSEKTHLLLQAMRAADSLRQVVLLDISEEVLQEAAEAIRDTYEVDVHAVVGDFRHHVEALAKGERRLWAFLGSTIGNFRPAERRRLLGEIAAAMADDDHLLLGTDLVKDPRRLVAAYDDAAGITAAFNRNLLVVLNRELDGDFDLERFEHRAVWDPDQAWIEMRLRSLGEQHVRLRQLGLSVDFADGEELRTETSAKLRPGQIRAELAEAGLEEVAAWQDEAGDVRVCLARRAPAGGTGTFGAIDEAWLRAKPGIKWQRYGSEVLPAWVADMDFPIPPVVRDALVELVEAGDLGYPDLRGGSPLRSAFAERMAERYGWEPDPGRVRELTDLIQGLQLSLHLATSPGDAVAIHTPAYPPFLSSITSMGRRLVPLPMEDTAAGWRFDPERAEDAVARSGARALVLVNPHNPTGRVFERAELEALAAIAARHDLVVVADEVHAELAYRPHRHLPFASLDADSAARTVTLTSATKAFNLAGIRCALAHFGPEALLSARDAEPSELFGQPSNLGMAATLAAWRRGGPWASSVLDRLVANRDLVAETLAAELPAVRHHRPEGTYLAWLDVRRFDLGADPAARLLERARVALGRGLDFGPGGEGFVRLNFATSPALLRAILERLIGGLQAS